MQREKGIHLIEAHVAAICFVQKSNEIKLLIGKRAADRMIFPSFWECGGGQVHKGETFIEAVKYHMKEEFGIEVEVLFPVCTYAINLPDKVIPGIRFVCHLKGHQDIHIDGEEIIDYKWILPSELNHFNLIPNLSDGVMLALKYYKKLI